MSSMSELRRIMAVVFLALCVAAGAARSQDNKQILAEEAVRLLKYEQIFASMRERCTLASETSDPTEFLNADPGQLSGITPQSPAWPKIVRIFREYQRSVCERLTEQEFIALFAAAYGEFLTEADFKAMIRFYRSPAGRKFAEANLQANERFQELANRRLRELTLRELIGAHRDLLQIQQKHDANAD